MFYSCKSQFQEKNPVLPIEKFPFFVLARNTIMSHLFIHFLLHYLSSGPLREVKNKGKFQTFSSKSGRGCLWEVVAFKRFQIWWSDFETSGILENWLLRRGSSLQEVVATGSSTVWPIYQSNLCKKKCQKIMSFSLQLGIGPCILACQAS